MEKFKYPTHTNQQPKMISESEAEKIVEDIMAYAKKRCPGIWSSKKIEYQPFPKKIMLDFSILITDN